jgi:hypothetical protein
MKMASIEIDIIKKVAIQKNKKTFHWKAFKKFAWPWALSGLLSLFPLILVFLMSPVDKLTLRDFLGNVEIIYVCVILTVVMIADMVRIRINFLFWIILATVIWGTVIYALLKTGEGIPVLNDSSNLQVFNLIFFVFVVLLGLVNYITLSLKARAV